MEMGSETELQLSGSLPVANVQALAAECLTEIPPRYLRQPDELGQLWPSTIALQIPVIDLGKLGDGSSWKETEMERLHSASKDWGFFQLINHGIPEEVIKEMTLDMEEFFKLPLPEKMAYEQLPHSMEGYGQAFVLSKEQKLDWGDMLFLLVQPPSQRKFRFWPKHPASFRATLEKYSSELLKVELYLLRVMAKNLGVDPDMFVKQFEGGIQAIRMNYYPPCPQASRVSGLTPHSDAVGITLLLQTSDVDGLQIKKEGKWLPIKPLPGALIVNIGDIIEIMSNGEYKSIEHRAVVNSEKERLSIAAFHSIKLEGTVGPLLDLTKMDRAHYKTMSNVDYVRHVSSLKLDGKSTLDLLKLDAKEINIREQ